MTIRKLEPSEDPPKDLLLLADPSWNMIADYLKRGECFVFEGDSDENKATVGVHVLLPTRPKTVELVNVAVEESHQGRGIGKKLVLHAIETAKTKGFKTIEVGTGNSSLSALGLYQKCGFRMTGIDRDFFVRHYDEEIWENGIQCRDMVRMGMDL